MPRVAPFRGLMYDVDVAGPLDRLTAPPYDVLSDPRRERLLGASRFNIAHVDVTDGGAADAGVHDDAYRTAGERLRAWHASGVLRRDDTARYHAYEMAYTLEGRQHHTRGMLLAMEVEPWGGDVLAHEDTMPGPVEDRLRLLRETRTHLSAVYATVAGPIEPLRELLDAAAAGAPAAQIEDEEGVVHRMWPIDADVPVDAWLSRHRAMLADGHHRYTTALAYRDERRAASGPGPWDAILALVIDAGTERMPVLPYHRLQLGGRPPPDGEPRASLEELMDALDDDQVRFGTVTSRGDELRFATRQLPGSPPTVKALHDAVLDAEAPGGHLRFTHEVDDAVAAVAEGSAVAAYLLPPTSSARIQAVVESGQRLPRKSTFYWPKPRTGIVMLPLDA